MATAIHAGHELRDEVVPHMALDEQSRLREEDPYTADWVAIGDTQITVGRSRFEVDLNRPRDMAVYRSPSEAWGMDVWHQGCPARERVASLKLYDDFYDSVAECLGRLLSSYGRLFVLDLHSYNHRREGPDRPYADQAGSPDINIGTGTLTDERHWRGAIEGFIDDLSRFSIDGRRLDVRENVRFRGGHFANWLHRSYAGRVCCLAVEVKKIFMDEWTGRLDEDTHAVVLAALRSAIPGLRRFLSSRAEDDSGSR